MNQKKGINSVVVRDVYRSTHLLCTFEFQFPVLFHHWKKLVKYHNIVFWEPSTTTSRKSNLVTNRQTSNK